MMAKIFIAGVALLLLQPAAAGRDKPAEQDVKAIQKARHFAFGPVGVAEAVSASEEAFWRLYFRYPDKSWVEPLLESDNPVAQAYAISALYLCDPLKVPDLIQPRREEEIRVMLGCISFGITFRELEKHLTTHRLWERAPEAERKYGFNEA